MKNHLLNAARSGDVAKVKQLIAAGWNVNAAESYNHTTALHAASYIGHFDVVQILIAAGADVNAPDNGRGMTPLMDAACGAGLVSVIDALIKAGANLNIQDHRGDTALHHAARNMLRDGFHFLLAAGADIDAENDDGVTPAFLVQRCTKLSDPSRFNHLRSGT